MKKIYLLGACLLFEIASNSFGSGNLKDKIDHSNLHKFEKSLSNVKFVDDFLTPESNKNGEVMWQPWKKAFTTADIPYDGKNIKFIVLHYTGLPYTGHLTRRRAPGVFDKKCTMAHFLVDGDGSVVNYVDPYVGMPNHAGDSFFAGYSKLNYWSIGITHTGEGYEKNPLENRHKKSSFGSRIIGDNGHWYEYPESQFQNSCELTKALQNEFNVPGFNVVTHADIAPGKQSDIGPMWDYKKAYDEYEVGYFPSETHQINMTSFVDFTGIDYITFIRCFGYDISAPMRTFCATHDTNIFNTTKQAVIKAYQLHYSTSDISGVLTDITKEDILKHVIALAQLGKNGYLYFNTLIRQWGFNNGQKVSAFSEYVDVVQ